MQALVTGGGGFLGSHLIEQLVGRGDQVRSLARRDYPHLRAMGVTTFQGDVRQYDDVAAAVEGVDTVFHTAAIAGLAGRWSDYYQINTVGTQHVIRACQQHGVARLVYSSSPSVTFDGTDQCGVDESVPYPTRWLAHYPRSKALAEQAVLSAHGSGGLATCALRPHLIWGPGDSHLVPRLIKQARRGRLRRVGDGRNLVDMVYVDNAAAAHLLAADRLAQQAPVGGKAYFISQGEPVNCWQWIDDILALVELPPIRRAISFKAAYRLGNLLEWVHRALRQPGDPRMTRFLACQLATSHYFDISAAREQLGYVPTVSTAEGMRRLGEWLGDITSLRDVV